jgi:phosphoribosylamine--glycine ligase
MSGGFASYTCSSFRERSRDSAQIRMKLDKDSNLIAAVIGKDGRTSAIRQCLAASSRVSGPVAVLSEGTPPGGVIDEVIREADRVKPDFVVVGPEGPLALGVVDALEERGIACVGPNRALARIEASKAYTRRLLTEHRIPGNPEHRIFERIDGVADYLRALGEFVVKPDGLTGGKGVKVSGDHLHSIDEGVQYCTELFHVPGSRVVIEEKLDGEEFSLQTFADGTHVVDTLPVQDHKRAFDGDAGPNTGGMGSYSAPDHLLPFLDQDALTQARVINARVARAIGYTGILFGGFMLTKNGVRLLEYNARFGDPECLNVLSVMETDFAAICLGIINGTLDQATIRFKPLATVCKYVVPEGYPSRPSTGVVDVSDVVESDSLRMYLAAVDPIEGEPHKYRMTGSRAIAFVGIGPTLEEANRHAEDACRRVRGPVRHRTDIGTAELLERRVRHMARITHSLAV